MMAFLHSQSKAFKINYLLFFQINDNNYQGFLEGWRVENKPSILLFDQVPLVPLLYKVKVPTDFELYNLS